MHIRSLVTATLLHGAIIVGIGLGVQSWVAQPAPPPQIQVMPSLPEFVVPDDARLVEGPAPPEGAIDAECVDPEFTPPPAPTPDDTAEAKPEDDRDIPDPVFAPPRPIRASADLLARIRQRPPVVAADPEPSPATVAASFVEATAREDENRPPTYPAAARRRGVEGEVVLLVTVDVHGEVSKVEILKSAGLTALHRQLERAAITAILSWHYTPARRGGVPVEAKIKVPVEFRLR